MDTTQVKIAVAVAPALLLMWYFDRLDAKRPEPRDLLQRTTIAGCLAVIPAGIIEYLLDPKPASFHSPYTYALAMAAMAGFVEELCKVACLRGYVWKKPQFDERLDGIVYATRIGLGFAAVENVLYLLGQTTVKGFLFVALLRAVLAVPGHAIWAGMMGYFAARRRFDGTGPGIIGGYLIAAILHTAYDAALFASPYVWDDGPGKALLAVPIGVIVLGGLALRMMAKVALREDDAHAARTMTPSQQVLIP